MPRELFCQSLPKGKLLDSITLPHVPAYSTALQVTPHLTFHIRLTQQSCRYVLKNQMLNKSDGTAHILKAST